MRYLSVCSGIEAASVAWTPLGWSPVAFSEIEPFPCAVLTHHYPDVPNLGDMTTIAQRILNGEVEAPDVLAGGTPCQSFSIAGLRKSLADERGNLTLKFVELADAIDYVRTRDGRPPSIIFWENVPGVLSTKDNAFGCFLGALAGEDCELKPPGKRWANAGAVYGPARAIAWRVLDAQYFGLAQRRRRVFVVASAREGFDPAAVLFEFEGVRRDTPPSREARQTAPTIPARSTGGGGIGTDFDCDGGLIARAVSLRGRDGGGTAELGDDLQNCLRASGGGGDKPYVLIHADPIARCDTAGEAKRQDWETCNFVAFHPTQDPISSTDGSTHALGCGSTGGQASVAVAYGIRTANTSSNGWGIQEEITHTLDGAMGIAVGAIAFDTTQITSAANRSNPQPLVPIAFQAENLVRGAGSPPSADVFPTLKADHGRGLSDQHPCVAVAFAIQAGALRTNPASGPDGVGVQADHAYTLEARAEVQAVQHAMQVRRLTPTEAERLQGFPDGYTAIPWRGKPASECPDGPRYKALGNSWAVPVVRWIGERINAAVEQIKREQR